MAARPQTGGRSGASEPAALLAVCGLGGGAGATTLAHLLARSAARSARRPVLLCDTGGPAAALAAQTGERSRLALGAASEAMTQGRLDARLFVALTKRLRLIAAPPALADAWDPAGLDALVAQACAAHDRVVCDCGTLQRPIERAVAARASRIVWALEADTAATRRAESALAALAPRPGARELLAARASFPGAEPARRELCALAEGRCAPLVLLPFIGGLAEHADHGLGALAAPLAAIEGALR